MKKSLTPPLNVVGSSPKASNTVPTAISPPCVGPASVVSVASVDSVASVCRCHPWLRWRPSSASAPSVSAGASVTSAVSGPASSSSSSPHAAAVTTSTRLAAMATTRRVRVLFGRSILTCSPLFVPVIRPPGTRGRARTPRSAGPRAAPTPSATTQPHGDARYSMNGLSVANSCCTVAYASSRVASSVAVRPASSAASISGLVYLELFVGLPECSWLYHMRSGSVVATLDA